jgi:alanine racemase
MSDTPDMTSSNRAERPCEATIDCRALLANLATATDLAGRRAVMAVVKADAYGHGAELVARVLVEAGCPRLVVLTVAEGEALRRAGIDVPLLVLAGARDDDEARRALSASLTPVLHDSQALRRLEAAATVAGARAPVHVEVDTGMHRMGVPAADAVAFLAAVAACGALRLEGVFTHFARADEPDLAPSLEQLARFREVLSEARARDIAPPLVHADNSAALLAGKPLSEALPEATAVRPGLMLYGVRPAAHLPGLLHPVMSLRASVLTLHDVPPNGGIGYGASFRAPAAGARIATLSIGYADGVPWTTGNRGEVWLGGARRKIVGRISMDSLAVDVTGAQVALGDGAVLCGSVDAGAPTGSPNPRSIPVEEAAASAGSLSYELLVRVGGRVPRVVRD